MNSDICLPIDMSNVRFVKKGGVCYVSVVDVVSVAVESDSKKGGQYWRKLKERLLKESNGSEPVTFCHRLKLLAADGKMRLTDVATIEEMLRIIQSIPSPKVEPIKQWLAKVGKERLEEDLEPAKAIRRGVKAYEKQGRNSEWIKKRLDGIMGRNLFTEELHERGINESHEYAMCTNTLYKTWSGMDSNEYKTFKGLKARDSLRDNMSLYELSLANIAETSTTAIMRDRNSQGLDEVVTACELGGSVAEAARIQMEKILGRSAITTNNNKAICR